MDFIQTSNKQIDKFGPGKHGFSAGNPALGVLATYFSATWADGVQQEIINVIEAAGLTPTDADLSLLLQAINIIGKGRFIGRRVITATGVYAPTPGTKFVDVIVVGGGGGGGGGAVTGAGQSSAGAGGGGGGWARKRITAGFSGVTVTIGAGGSGGVIAVGAAGGTTSFGALVSASGGGGGSFGDARSSGITAANGSGVSGSGAGGDLNGVGNAGNYAIYAPNPVSGKGGASLLGDGATYVTGGYLSGANSPSLGGGGSGGAGQASTSGTTGGAGGAGLCIVDEFS